MNEEELRIKIYERLGLEFGSLTSESGNDWVRAEKEILEEYRRKEFEKLQEIKSVDYLSIEKNTQEFQIALNSKSFKTQYFKILIAQRSDLTNQETIALIETGGRDVVTNLARKQKLDTNMIDMIIPNSVYATKKYLIENQALSGAQKTILLEQMAQHKDTYTTLYEKLKSQIIG